MENRFDIGDKVRTPFSDEVLEIVDICIHYGHREGVIQEIDYQTSDGEWHYDGWYFEKVEQTKQS